MQNDNTPKMSANVILIDAAYIDQVAFHLTVNFERMLERRIPHADLAHWLDCVALDGGITPGDNDIQVIFIYSSNKPLANFTPSDLEKEVNGKAFKDNLGEFTMEAYPVATDVTDAEDFFIETLRVVLDSETANRIILVPNMEQSARAVVNALAKKPKEKEVTILTMQPTAGNGFDQQILGYSVMSALGIRSEELENR